MPLTGGFVAHENGDDRGDARPTPVGQLENYNATNCT
jgi:hypothetical protein